MDTFELKLENLEFQETCANYSSVYGTFYARVNGNGFPEDGWYDAASSMLEMWLDEILEFTNNSSEAFLYFMNGPYLLRLTKLNNDKITISCISDHRIEQARVVVDLYEFIRNLLEITDSFITQCGKAQCPFVTTERYKHILDTYNQLESRRGSVC